MTAQEAWARATLGIARLERRKRLLYAEAGVTPNGSDHCTALLDEIDALDGAILLINLGCPTPRPDGSVWFDRTANPHDHLPGTP